MRSPLRAGLGHRTLAAAQWRLASSLVQGGFQFAVGVVLARLLPPSDFGLVALATTVVGLAGLVSDLGLGTAVVQRRPLTDRHLRVAFTTTMAMGVAIALLTWASASLISALLRNPSVSPVLRVESLLFIFSSLGVTARGLLRRSLSFRRLFQVDLCSYVFGYALVAVILAVSGFGVWSLVVGALVQNAISSGLLLAVAKPPVLPLLSRREFGDMVGFGAGVSLNLVVNYAARNGDNLVVGRWLGTGMLGLYARAYNLMMLPQSYFTSAISNVLFPAFSEISEDRQRLARAYLLAVQVSSMVAAPLMAMMIVSAPHMIGALYGQAWLGAVLPLQIMCSVGVFRTVYHVSGSVTHACGQVYAELRRQLVYAGLVLGGAIAGSSYGITGVAFGVSAAIVYMYLAMARLTIRITDSSWRDFFGAQVPALVIGGAVAVAAIAARLGLEQRGASSLLILLAVGAAATAALVVTIYLLPRSMRPVELFSRFERASHQFPRLFADPLRRILRVPVSL